LSATTAIVAIMGFVVAWCHLPPPSSSSLSTTSQPYQQCNHCRLAPILLPPCNPPPPHCRRALSALSIAHGAILDRHASSTSSGMTRRVPLPLPPAPPSSKDGPVTAAAMHRSPLRRPALDPPLLLGMPPIRQRQQQHIDVDAHPRLRRRDNDVIVFFQGLMGGALAMVRWQSRVMAVCCGCLLLVVVCCGVVRESNVWYATKITNTGAKSCTN
jgi:hypothetical protein